jgi:hypothetical protein
MTNPLGVVLLGLLGGVVCYFKGRRPDWPTPTAQHDSASSPLLHDYLRLLEVESRAVRRLAAQGIEVRVIDERQFWRLVKPIPRARSEAVAGVSKARHA